MEWGGRGRTGYCSVEVEIDAYIAPVGGHYRGVFLHLLRRVAVSFPFVPVVVEGGGKPIAGHEAEMWMMDSYGVKHVEKSTPSIVKTGEKTNCHLLSSKRD